MEGEPGLPAPPGETGGDLRLDISEMKLPEAGARSASSSSERKRSSSCLSLSMAWSRVAFWPYTPVRRPISIIDEVDAGPIELSVYLRGTVLPKGEDGPRLSLLVGGMRGTSTGCAGRLRKSS